MPRTRWSLLALCLLVAVLIAYQVGKGRRIPDTSTPDFSPAARQLDADFRAHLRTVADAYQSGNATAHARATVTTLHLMNRASIRALLPQVDSLVEAINAQGAAPYPSIAIDFGQRLARIDQPPMQEKFTALAKVVLAPSQKDSLTASARARMAGYVRTEGRPEYMQYDTGTTSAAAQMLFSEFGRAQMLQGQTATDVIRQAAMVWECQRDDPKAPRSDDEKKSCAEFVDYLSKKLDDSGQQSVLPAAMSGLQNGTRLQPFTCGQRELSGLAFIEAVEAYNACMLNQSRSPTGARMDGPSLSREWSGPAPNLPGWQYVAGSSKETVRYGPNGNTATQVDHQYTNGTGGTATVSTYTMKVNGQESSGTHIAIDDGAGWRHEEHQDAQGATTWEHTTHKNGDTETFSRSASGDSSHIVTHSDGTSEVTYTDSKGNVRTAKIGKDDVCTGEACDATMSVDDDHPMGEGCSIRVGRTGNSGRMPLDPLGPYIYPDPDNPRPSPAMACIQRAVGRGSASPRCPPSVVLCLDPPPLGQCGCAKPDLGSPLPPRNACERVQCGEGASCDPSTGACRSFTKGGLPGAFSPGSKPLPRPSFKLPPIPGK